MMLLRERRWRMFAIEWVFDTLVLTYLFGVNVVVPFAQEEFGASRAAAAWILIGHSLGTVAVILPAAFLGNTLGRKPVLLAGLCLEAGGLVAIFYAPDLPTIIGLQVLQGAGNAMRFSNMMAMVQGGFPAAERGRTLGLIAMAHGIGALIATPIAGLIADTIGWRWVFLVNVPVYLFAIGGVTLVYKDAQTAARARPRLRDFDYAGTIAMALGITTLVLGLQGLRTGTGALGGVLLLGVAIGAFVAFVATERRSPHPLIDLGLFRLPTFVAGSGLAFLFAIINATVVLLVPFYLIQGLGWSGASAGSVLVAVNIGRPVLAPMSGWLTDRIGSGVMVSVASGFTALGAGLCATLGASPPTAFVLFALTLVGVGFGLFQVPNNKQLFTSVPADKLSLAPGVTLLGGHGGRAVGTTAAAGLLAALTGGAGVVGAFSASMLAMTAVFVAGALLLLLAVARPAARGAPAA